VPRLLLFACIVWYCVLLVAYFDQASIKPLRAGVPRCVQNEEATICGVLVQSERRLDLHLKKKPHDRRHFSLSVICCLPPLVNIEHDTSMRNTSYPSGSVYSLPCIFYTSIPEPAGFPKFHDRIIHHHIIFQSFTFPVLSPLSSFAIFQAQPQRFNFATLGS
jgi:hypothetical protein